MRHSRRGEWLLFAVAVAANLVLLFWPRAVGTGGVPHLDKAAHAVSFGLVMATGVRVGLATRPLAGLLTVHAISSEVIQHGLLEGRTGDPLDVLADLGGVAGVVLAAGAASWSRERRRRDGHRDDRAASRREPDAG